MNESILNIISSKIIENVDPEKIILFGSYAGNRQTADSDIDIMIILKNDSNHNRSKFKTIASLRKSLIDVQIPKDILIFNEREIKEWQHSKNHIISRALNEGLCIYERSKTC